MLQKFCGQVEEEDHPALRRGRVSLPQEAVAGTNDGSVAAVSAVSAPSDSVGASAAAAPFPALIEGRWCLQLFSAVEQLHGARVFLRMCGTQGAALVRIQLAPAAQRLRLRTLVPVYEMAMGHRQRLRAMGCGITGKAALLMLQSKKGPPDRSCFRLLGFILDRWASGRVSLTADAMHAKAERLRASGQCASAAVLLQEAMFLGHLPARADMANMLLDGREGVAKDRDTAFALAEQGARSGCHHCKGVLANCYRGGYGCSPNAAQGLLHAQQSLASGSKYGQYAMGQMQRCGEGGLSQDYAGAAAHYGLAVAQNLDAAHCNLGLMYDRGLGVAQDRAEALRLYMIAALQGLPGAIYNVGNFHKNGWVVVTDRSEAIRWFNRAAAAGQIEAALRLNELRHEDA